MRSLWPIEWVGEFVTETPSGWRIHRVQFTFDSIVLRVCTIYFRILSNSYIQYYMRRFLLPFKVFAWNMCVCVCIIWRERKREEKKVLRKWVRELDDSTDRSIRHMSPYLDLYFLLSYVCLLVQFYSNLSRKYASLTFFPNICWSECESIEQSKRFVLRYSVYVGGWVYWLDDSIHDSNQLHILKMSTVYECKQNNEYYHTVELTHLLLFFKCLSWE